MKAASAMPATRSSQCSFEEMTPLWSGWIQQSDFKQLVEHPLLIELESPDVAQTTIRTLLVQHFYYSQYFTRYLCAVISNLDEANDVKSLAHNLCEEVGFDDEFGRTHSELYGVSLAAIGASIETAKPFDATKELIREMFARCRSADPMDGLAALCLGAEAIVPTIYRPILVGLRTLGVCDHACEFFKLHVEEDEGHATIMLNIMNRIAGGDAYRKKAAIKVGSVMISRRVSFLNEVWKNSKEEFLTMKRRTM